MANNINKCRIPGFSPRSRGTNQTGMRASNERLLLSLIREHGPLAKTDIAKMTGLSAQTTSVIMRGLEAEELLVRGEPLRGKVGQPLVPMSLNPDGALFLGLKVGRRSAQVVLIDLMGKVRKLSHQVYSYPTPEMIIRFAVNSVNEIITTLKPKARKRIAGLGIAMPFELWSWAEIVGAPDHEMNAWKSTDIRAILASKLPYPVYMQNDATAACGAELAFGNAHKSQDFVYFYIGYFVGGGVVMNAALQVGRSGNAGALGSMPVHGPDRQTRQLIDVASISVLESRLVEKGGYADWLWDPADLWQREQAEISRWIDESARALALAIVSASSVIEFEAAVVDGWLPRNILRRLINAVKANISDLNITGLKLPTVHEGAIGKDARVIGAASLPLSERFLIGQAVMYE